MTLGEKDESYRGDGVMDGGMRGVGAFRGSGGGEYQVDNSPPMAREGESMRAFDDNSQLLRITDQVGDLIYFVNVF